MRNWDVLQPVMVVAVIKCITVIHLITSSGSTMFATAFAPSSRSPPPPPSESSSLFPSRRTNGMAEAHHGFCALAYTFSLTPCFSWGLDDLLTRQPFQRLSADDKPLKAVARSRPPS